MKSFHWGIKEFLTKQINEFNQEKLEMKNKMDELDNIKSEYQKAIIHHSTILDESKNKENEYKNLVNDKSIIIQNLLKEIESYKTKLLTYQHLNLIKPEIVSNKSMIKDNMLSLSSHK